MPASRTCSTAPMWSQWPWVSSTEVDAEARGRPRAGGRARWPRRCSGGLAGAPAAHDVDVVVDRADDEAVDLGARRPTRPARRCPRPQRCHVAGPRSGWLMSQWPGLLPGRREEDCDELWIQRGARRAAQDGQALPRGEVARDRGPPPDGDRRGLRPGGVGPDGQRAGPPGARASPRSSAARASVRSSSTSSSKRWAPRCCCSPYFSTVALAANALLFVGTDADKAAYLPGIASGETIATVALTDDAGRGTSPRRRRRPSATGDGWSSQRRAQLRDRREHRVADPRAGDDRRRACRSSRSRATRRVVAREAAGDDGPDAQAERASSSSDAPAALVGVEGERARGARDDRCRSPPPRSPPSRSAAPSACSNNSVEYAKNRVQFGRPIGSFQAIKHKCADMLLDVESAKSAAYYAAWAAQERNDELADRREPRQVLLLRGLLPLRGGEHPDPRRHRLHLGAPRAPLLQARQELRVVPGRPRLPPRTAGSATGHLAARARPRATRERRLAARPARRARRARARSTSHVLRPRARAAARDGDGPPGGRAAARARRAPRQGVGLDRRDRARSRGSAAAPGRSRRRSGAPTCTAILDARRARSERASRSPASASAARWRCASPRTTSACAGWPPSRRRRTSSAWCGGADEFHRAVQVAGVVGDRADLLDRRGAARRRPGDRPARAPSRSIPPRRLLVGHGTEDIEVPRRRRARPRRRGRGPRRTAPHPGRGPPAARRPADGRDAARLARPAPLGSAVVERARAASARAAARGRATR